MLSKVVPTERIKSYILYTSFREISLRHNDSREAHRQHSQQDASRKNEHAHIFLAACEQRQAVIKIPRPEYLLRVVYDLAVQGHGLVLKELARLPFGAGQLCSYQRVNDSGLRLNCL